MTQRSRSELDTLFADNDVGAITPAMLRDFAESVLPSTGALVFDSGPATTIAVPGTFVKPGNTTTGNNLRRFTAADDRLTYTGVVPADVVLQTTVSLESASNNQVLEAVFAVNGTPMAETSGSRVAAGSDIQEVTVMVLTTLQPGDYVEVWVTNKTSTADVTIDAGQIIAVGYLT